MVRAGAGIAFCQELGCQTHLRDGTMGDIEILNSSGVTDKRPNPALRSVKHKILVLSGKGGVGKSTVAVNLAAGLAREGRTVGLLDVDIHGPSVPKMLGMGAQPLTVNEKGFIVPALSKHGIKVVSMAFLISDVDSPIIWRGPAKMAAIRQFLNEVDWGNIDYLIVDLPPGTGDEPLTIAQLIPDADGAVVVTTPQDLALLSVRKSINFVRKMGISVIGLIDNMNSFVCPHCGEEVSVFGSSHAKAASVEFSIPYLGSLPLSPLISKKGDEGTPFASEGDAAGASFVKIVNRIMTVVERT